MIVIGIVGPAGAGKSTVANRLIERHGFERGKFAAALKEMLRALLRYRGADSDLIERMIEGDRKEKPSALLNGRTPRHAMQTLGDEWGRQLIDRNLWVDTERSAVLGRSREALVFDDVRYPNEVDAIYRLGGQIWRVGRTIADLRPEPGVHASESLDVAADSVLLNNATKSELHANVDITLAGLRRRSSRAA